MTDDERPILELNELAGELQRLWRKANNRSLRRLAATIGTTYTEVDGVMRGERLPDWHIVKQVVEGLGGEWKSFQPLWNAAAAACAERRQEQRHRDELAASIGPAEIIAQAIREGLAEIAHAIRPQGRGHDRN